MAIKKIFCGDFIDQVRKLEEATDGRGNKLYDREEIAEMMGFTRTEYLEKKLKEARKLYRNGLQEKVRRMEKEGSSIDEISERTKMTADTINVLLDTEFDENCKFANDFKERTKKANDEFAESINKSIEEMNKAFGNDSLFNRRW